MVLEPIIKINAKDVTDMARASTVESTAGYGIGAIIKCIFALAFVQTLVHGHRKSIKRLRTYRRKRAKIFG